MNFDSLYWREPLWLITFLLPWLIILSRYYYQKKCWNKIADPHLFAWCYAHPHSSGQTFRNLLLTIAWLLFCVALAGPRTPRWIPPSLQEENVSIRLIIDYSRSMNAVANNSNRIVQAQNLIKHWLQELPPQIPLGLSIFSGHSHTLLLPTTDKALLKHFVDQLHMLKPPTLGNNLADSLQAAEEQLKALPRQHYIIVVSDGDLGKKSADAAQNIASQFKTKARLNLIVIGVGKDEAVRIPMPETKILTHKGKVIITRRHILLLKKLAEVSGGSYYPAEAAAKLKLEQVLDLPKARIKTKFEDRILWHEWFFIPLLGGIFFSLLALQISARRTRKLSGVALMVLLSGCYQTNELGEEDFSQGITCYRLKNYSCAQQFFAEAAWSAADPLLQAKAVFNLGNTYFQLGDYEQALVLFKDAELRGIATTKTRINQQFSATLAAAVQQRLMAIAKTKEKADWLAAAGKLPEGFEGRLAEGLSFKQAPHSHSVFFDIDSREKNLLLEYGIKRLQNSQKIPKSSSSNSWVFSTQNKQAQDSAALFNELMVYEVGLQYVPDEPLQIEGQRSW